MLSLSLRHFLIEELFGGNSSAVASKMSWRLYDFLAIVRCATKQEGLTVRGKRRALA